MRARRKAQRRDVQHQLLPEPWPCFSHLQPKKQPRSQPWPQPGCPKLSISPEVKLGTGAGHHLRPPPVPQEHRVCAGRPSLHFLQQDFVCHLGTGAGDGGSWGGMSSSSPPAGHGLSSKVGDEEIPCPSTQLGQNSFPPPFVKADQASFSPTGMTGCFTEHLGSGWGGELGKTQQLPHCHPPKPAPNVCLGVGTPVSSPAGGTVRWMLGSLLAPTKPSLPEMLCSSGSILGSFWSQAATA